MLAVCEQPLEALKNLVPGPALDLWCDHITAVLCHSSVPRVSLALGSGRRLYTTAAGYKQRGMGRGGLEVARALIILQCVNCRAFLTKSGMLGPGQEVGIDVVRPRCQWNRLGHCYQ